MKYIDEFLSNAKKMGIAGLVMIIVASLLFLRNFEYIVNRIFHVQPRTILHRLRIYLVIFVLTILSLVISFYGLAIVVGFFSILSAIKLYRIR